MAWDGMGAFVRALEQRGELVRIRRRVDPHLEVAAIADRVMKAGGPGAALRGRRGLALPAPHQRVRLAPAHVAGARRRRPRGARPRHRGARPHASAPSSARELAQLALKLPELAHVPPAPVATGALPGGRRAPATTSISTRCPSSRAGPTTAAPSSRCRRSSRAIPRPAPATSAATGCRSSTARSTAMHWQIHKTGARHFRRAQELGLTRLDVAVALGGDPALTYAATAPLPDGIDEWMFAGFLRKRAVAHRAAARPSTSRSRPTPTSCSRATSTRSEALVDEGPVRRSHRLLHAGRAASRAST